MTKTIEQINAELAVLANQRAHLKAMDKLQNEGGEGYSAYEDQAMEIARKEYALEQELFAIEWTAEVTTARRAVWNGEMQKLVAAKKQATTKILNEVSIRIGFTMVDLKKAISINNL